MKGLALSLKRLACCMSPESMPEPAHRVISPSTSTRPTNQSSARSQPLNETVPAHTQDAGPNATSLTRLSIMESASQQAPACSPPHSSTMDDANEEDPACSSPCTSTTSETTLAKPEQGKSPNQTAGAVLCSLERLPVEIQTRILAESSLDSLRAIHRCSPRFYYVYSQNRLPILRNVLTSALDGFFLDAYASCMSDRYFPAAARAATWDHLRYEYLKSPNTVPSALTIDGLSLEIIQQMAQFHLRVVEPLTERYCLWALGALSPLPQAAPLTKTEKSRIQRAMYRLQVICNFGIPDAQGMLAVLDSFGPWATEQIVCVHKFAKERLSSVFIECAWELNEDENRNSRCRHDMLSVEKEWLLLYHEDSEFLNVDTLCDLLSAGLPVLQETFKAKDFDELCDVIIENVEFYGGQIHRFEWIDEAVREDHQSERHEQWYSKHNEPQNTQQEMLFEQDDLLSPPLAWVTFWGGRYSNQFGGYIPDALHRWGYVMWDASRLNESGAMEYIELEWQSRYGIRGSPEDGDPRDYYITAYQNHQQQLGNDG